MELSVKFASQICHENINKPLDGTYLADFGIDIKHTKRWLIKVTAAAGGDLSIFICKLSFEQALAH